MQTLPRLDYTHAQNETVVYEYERVIFCTGFCFDTEIFIEPNLFTKRTINTCSV